MRNSPRRRATWPARRIAETPPSRANRQFCKSSAPRKSRARPSNSSNSRHLKHRRPASRRREARDRGVGSAPLPPRNSLRPAAFSRTPTRPREYIEELTSPERIRRVRRGRFVRQDADASSGASSAGAPPRSDAAGTTSAPASGPCCRQRRAAPFRFSPKRRRRSQGWR